MAGQEESRLTLREHMEELRKRLFVAALAVALAGPLFSRTTGAQLPVDGGNERVI